MKKPVLAEHHTSRYVLANLAREQFTGHSQGLN